MNKVLCISERSEMQPLYILTSVNKVSDEAIKSVCIQQILNTINTDTHLKSGRDVLITRYVGLLPSPDVDFFIIKKLKNKWILEKDEKMKKVASMKYEDYFRACAH
jgi:hypothetical protein